MPWRRRAPLSTPEDRFLLLLLNRGRSRGGDKELARAAARGLDWKRVVRADFARPFLCARAGAPAPEGVPERVRSAAEAARLRNALLNERRIRLIGRIAGTLRAAGIPVVFVKGASEIVRFYGSDEHMGARTMDDVDFFCAPERVDEADRALRAAGHVWFRNYDKYTAAERWRSGQYVYGRGLEQVELHWEPSNTAEGMAGYPEGFSAKLRASAEAVELRGAEVLVPRPEMMLAYLVCAASNRGDNALQVSRRRGTGPLFSWDSYCQDRAQDLLEDAGQVRSDAQQLAFLFRLRAFMDACGSALDPRAARRALDTVRDRRLLDIYLGLAARLLEGCPPLLSSAPSLEELFRRRAEFIAREKRKAVRYRIVRGIPRRLGAAAGRALGFVRRLGS
ncbi:MAG TPA: nucleotidyltransferase family protein [Elusimicrobiota bacterium]|nr:nucleotidyltransferase family protein [Elusimicrobiota bacterium]